MAFVIEWSSAKNKRKKCGWNTVSSFRFHGANNHILQFRLDLPPSVPVFADKVFLICHASESLFLPSKYYPSIKVSGCWAQ